MLAFRFWQRSTWPPLHFKSQSAHVISDARRSFCALSSPPPNTTAAQDDRDDREHGKVKAVGDAEKRGLRAGPGLEAAPLLCLLPPAPAPGNVLKRAGRMSPVYQSRSQTVDGSTATVPRAMPQLQAVCCEVPRPAEGATFWSTLGRGS